MKGLINHDDIAKVLISEEQIKQRIAELGAELRKDYADVEGEIVLICILKGAVMFFADLARAMDLNMQMEFMGISSLSLSAVRTFPAFAGSSPDLCFNKEIVD